MLLMKDPTTAASINQFGRFLIVGALNTAFGYGVFYAMFTLTQSTIIAPVVATVAGIFFNFVTTGTLVFRDLRSALLGRFILVYAVQVTTNITLLELLSIWKIEPVIGQLIILPIIAIGSFWGLRKFVFNACSGEEP